MKKRFRVILSLLAVMALLVACGDSSNSNGNTTVKLGVASTQMVAESLPEDDDKVEFNTVVVGVALQDDKVAYISIDQSEQIAEGDGKVVTIDAMQTKKEKGADYGLLPVSEKTGLGKEWMDQIAGVEENLIGKTIDEVKAYFAGEEILTSATIDLDEIEATVIKAMDSVVEVSNVSKVGLGYKVAVEVKEDGTRPESNLTYAMVAFDSDDKVIEALLDSSQEKAKYTDATWDTTAIGKTKGELKEDYGMIVASPIEKEWFQQADAFMEYVKGKTVSDIMAVTDPSQDDDLKTSVTMSIDDLQVAIEQASKNAKDLK